MSHSFTAIVVKGTFALLLLGSVLTWALVLLKARQRWTLRRQDRRFLGRAGGVLRLPALRELHQQRLFAQGPVARLTAAGIAAIDDLLGGDGGAGEDTPRAAAERALQIQLQKERRAAEGGLAVLASIGTTSPFVGLFGTVWGIIQALRAIGSTGSASLEVVAGPIGEALVATGLGIAVAVPAVLAYNYFVRGLKLRDSELEQVAIAFLGAVARDAHRAPLRAAGEPNLRVERTGDYAAARREASL
jgi:biopolymer transport protein ExbB